MKRSKVILVRRERHGSMASKSSCFGIFVGECMGREEEGHGRVLVIWKLRKP
jgi:hypothetical protein